MYIRQYNGFQADGRISMDVYADQLARVMSDAGFALDAYRPSSSLERFSSSKMIMRGLRYIAYPMSLKHEPADIHHVVDHGYAHIYPKLRSGKTIVTVHDLIPLLASKGRLGGKLSSSGGKPLLNKFSLSFLKKYDVIICPSQNTANDLQDLLGIPQGKIEVIPPVLNKCFKVLPRTKVREFRAKHNLDSKCRWILISGREFYKNHRISLQVIKKLNQSSSRKIMMLRTGIPDDNFDKLVEECGVSRFVRQLYLENAEEMAVAYNFAHCLLFPSIYEGFGMPVVESIACGTPVVTSDRGSLPELFPDKIPHLNPYDMRDISKTVYRTMTDQELAKGLRANSEELVKQYRIEEVGEAIIQLYQSLIS